MKHKYPIMIAAVLLGLTVTLFADEKQTGSTAPHITADSISFKPRIPQVIRLKANAVTVAELRVLQARAVDLISQQADLSAADGRITAKGGVTIRIMHAGSAPVEVKADEIEADTLFAAEQQTANAAAKLIELKSQGEAIAELRLLKNTTVVVAGNETLLVAKTRTMTSKGGVTIQINVIGGSPITIKADEIKMISNEQ